MCDVAFVEAIARSLKSFVTAFGAIGFLRLDQLLQCTGKVGILQNVASFRRMAVGKIDLDGCWILQDFLRLGDVRGASLAQWKAVFGKIDRRLQHLLEVHRAPVVEEDVPGVDHTWDPSREKTVALGDLAS